MHAPSFLTPVPVRKLAAILVPLSLLACEREPAAPAIQRSPQLSAAVTNQFEYAWPGRATWLDSQDDWDVLLLGYDPADDFTCHDGADVGGIPVLAHEVVTQVGFPFGGARVQELVTTIGRPPLYLYRRADFPAYDAPFSEWCAFLTQDWIAAGSWSATLANDNDVTGFDATPGDNSFGGTETGTLLGTDGTRYRYEWKYRARCNPDWGCTTMHLVDHVVRIGE